LKSCVVLAYHAPVRGENVTALKPTHGLHKIQSILAKFETTSQAMLLARIQRDLFDFTNQEDPNDFGPLLNFWYRANTPALSAALTAQPGLKLIIDAPSVRSLEQMTQKLFLIADTIVLRGLSPEPPHDIDQLEPEHLTPTSNYKPGYIDEVIAELGKWRPSPLTITGPTPYWTSTAKTLKSGLHAAYAMDMHRLFHPFRWSMSFYARALIFLPTSILRLAFITPQTG
jgi:hypothetical protein